MSTSTDGVLYFGFDFHDIEGSIETDWMLESEDPIDDKFKALCPVKDESGLFTEEGEYTHPRDSKEHEIADKANDVFRDKFAEFKDELTSNGMICINMHCHHEYPIYFVYTRMYSASRGYSQEIDVANMAVGQWEIDLLKEFCEKMDIEWQEPKWRLASYWG